jgi:voltage-gated potassium channel
VATVDPPGQQAKVPASQVSFPAPEESPWWALARRLLLAIGVLALTVLIVYLDRDGYRDAADPTDVVDLSDAIYYTTVTLSTTGYGDITPVSQSARLVNAFVITPLRIAFLVLLIGTTIEALTSESRKMFRIAQWRKRMKNHVVVVGYGTKGRSATESLLGNGVRKEEIVVVDPTSAAQAEANGSGLTVIRGDATRRDVLRRAGAADARQIIVSTDSDDSTILCVLNARQLNKDAHIVAAVRESDNVHLVKQSGADSVVTSSDAVGRLLGLSALSPSLGSVIDDLITHGEEAAAAAARPGHRGGARQPGAPLLRACRHPARARRQGRRRTPVGRAAVGAATRHARRGLRLRDGGLKVVAAALAA